MPADANPQVFTGTVGAGVVFNGSWRRFLVKNRDVTNTFGIKINGETNPYTVDQLTAHGDVYGSGPGITRVELVTQGGNPAYELKLHY